MRIAPNHVSIADPDALEAVYGHGKGTTKPEFYDGECSIYIEGNPRTDRRDFKLLFLRSLQCVDCLTRGIEPNILVSER